MDTTKQTGVSTPAIGSAGELASDESEDQTRAESAAAPVCSGSSPAGQLSPHVHFYRQVKAPDRDIQLQEALGHTDFTLIKWITFITK